MLGARGLGFLAAAPSSNPVDCGNYHRAENIAAERLVALHRGSLRIFEACDAGHLHDVQAKFVELEMRPATPTNAN